MKLPLAVGLISLLPMSTWAVPVASSLSGSNASFAAQAGAQHSSGGMVFGGFFTLYNFAVVSPLVPAAKILQIDAVAPVDTPAVDSPYAQPLTDELEAIGEPDDTTPLLLVHTGTPILAVESPFEEAYTTVRVIAGPIRPPKGAPFPSVTDVPEPSTLSLAALAAVALVAFSGHLAKRHPRSSRRRILPTGLFGRSSRNSTTFGRL